MLPVECWTKSVVTRQTTAAICSIRTKIDLSLTDPRPLDSENLTVAVNHFRPLRGRANRVWGLPDVVGVLSHFRTVLLDALLHLPEDRGLEQLAETPPKNFGFRRVGDELHFVSS
jgi:hypothetical protein